METITCGECGEPFETRENYLSRNNVCPDCFAFPDVAHDETAAEDHTVYLAASVSAGMHGTFHAAYFRVAARSKADARFFVRAYQRLEDAVNDPKLADLAFDGDEQILTRPGAAPTTVRVLELPPAEHHDGYCVTKLGTRNGDDYAEQMDYGPNTTDKLPDPDMTPKDVLVHAIDDQIDHKLEDNVPDDHLCYWTVSGTPQQTRFGQRIWFEHDGRLVACGQIHSTETGKIWFSPLWEVDLECPTTVPNQGFKYVDPIETFQRSPEGIREEFRSTPIDELPECDLCPVDAGVHLLKRTHADDYTICEDCLVGRKGDTIVKYGVIIGRQSPEPADV